MIKAAVCDDNTFILEDIKKMLSKFISQNPSINISFDYYSDGATLLAEPESYNIYLLDIEIGNINGIDVARQIHKKSENALIFFITSHDSFLDDALDTRPFRYLRKPIEEKRLFTGINSAINQLKSFENFIIVHNKKDIIKVKTKDIAYVTIEKRKTAIVSCNETIFVDEKYSEVQEMLENSLFVSSHKSFFINLEYVHSFNATDVTLKIGDELKTVDMSRRNYKGFTEKFLEYARTKN